ncbi:F1-F0 ATPase (N-ATPase) AtpR subunit [Breoghania corrubedonensis]|uniref:F1-F0 ATPase (N-ATPase) AtpR subunit n=1 Tax=Breoghania corrubedonensis TaxID=665038 RepID=A0A2T5VBF9_9HYPH|nr:ATP synthase subunit I [Breoghania corrubedonensis]PTW61084.1 F1-F0 ATPase (N-ATPase) AtpR subunit [Breoghania corrubedonensis]
MSPTFAETSFDPATLAALAAFFIFGMALGAGYFFVLKTSATLFAHKAILAAAALTVVRMAVLAACLYFVSRAGALPLLIAALGLLVARQLVMRRFSRSTP